MMLDPLELAQSLSLPGAFDAALLFELQRSIGAEAAFFAIKGAAPVTIGIDARALGSALQQGLYDDEIGPLQREAMARRGVVVDTAVYGESAVRRTRYHRDFAAPIGGRHSLMAYLVLRGRMLGGIMLGRIGQTFSPRDVATIEAVLPRIAMARASYGLPAVDVPLPRPSEGDRTLAVGTVTVRDRDGYREMVAGAGKRQMIWSRSELAAPHRSGWFYVDLFHLAAARARHRRRALFIGCGGAVALRQFARSYPGIAIDVAELDAGVIALARTWYALDAIPGVTAHHADGVAFVTRAPPRTWDVVVVDAYAGDRLPPAFAKRPFFAAVREALTEGGAMAINVVGPLAGSGQPSAVARAMGAELDDVRLVPVLDEGEAYSPHAARNVVILGSYCGRP
jgi:hypothetical protein